MDRRKRQWMGARGVWGLVLLPPLVVAALSGAQSGDRWYEHYHRALQAVDLSDWDRAIDEFEAAVEEREGSSRSARTYGVRFIRYFPYYYLGVAHFSLGHEDEALRFLTQESVLGEIQRSEEHAERLRILMAAIRRPAAMGDARDLDIEELERLFTRGARLQAEGRSLEAMTVFERIIAVDPSWEGVEAALHTVRITALQEELASFEVLTRAAGPDEDPVSESEVALFEAKAREIFQRGVSLMSEGDLEGALTRFHLTLVFLEDEGWTSRQLYDEALEHREIVAAEVRQAREAELRARMAESADLPRTPPDIMLISPSNLDEPVTSEIVRLQGVVHDNYGIRSITILVNGEELGGADVGLRKRGLLVVSRPAPGGDEGLGTFAQFSKDLLLTDDRNQVVVRVANLGGEETELEAEIRVDRVESRVFAAVIGVGDYQDGLIPDLSYSVADAEAFLTYLREDLAVPSERVFALLDEDATYGAIRRLLRTELRRQAKPTDQVIIYFAGHGAPDQFGDVSDGDGVEKYFLPYDTDAQDISGTGYPMQELAEALARLESGRVVFIADACFSGASGGRTFGAGGGATISDGFLGRMTGESPGRVVLSASGPNEPSLESRALGHGIFTYFLLDGLRGAADADGNNVITVPEAYSYVARVVPERTGRRQHPMMSGVLGGEMVLGRTGAN